MCACILQGVVACAYNLATQRLGLGDCLLMGALCCAMPMDGTKQPDQYGDTQP